jgi:hypothetical protein
MSVPIWSIVKFKVKQGSEEKFITAAKEMEKIDEKYTKSFRTIQLEDNEFCFIVEFEDMDAVIESQMDALTWLDDVTDLLETVEGSRTIAMSGFVV